MDKILRSFNYSYQCTSVKATTNQIMYSDFFKNYYRQKYIHLKVQNFDNAINFYLINFKNV
jgi:hypothetical protein